ncbi:hypothetical protein CPB83DRAFT_889444 [Crepidotus variabilis]|uniref:Uncharacterized protein n=1 Tax=Crepidotus variabilis TaxID=179855 RepID=A0A9P6EQY2_9AGAR|nr:hypothetical protein CPB83DRAFT_889444 [Crepidotus variabilis]
MRERVGKDIQDLVGFLRPEERSISALLIDFSLSEVLEHAKKVTSTLLEALTASVGGLGDEESGAGRKKKDVIICTVLCVLAKTQNERGNEFQLLMYIYLLACSVSRFLFDVLNDAGFSMPYSSAMDKIKALGQEQLDIRRRTSYCERIQMVIWTAELPSPRSLATVIPLYNVPFWSLSVVQPRKKRRITYDFNRLDLLPSTIQVLAIQETMRWHIANILFELFPDLKALPAALIGESTIDGTRCYRPHILPHTQA